jgi:hypothetical protein
MNNIAIIVSLGIAATIGLSFLENAQQDSQVIDYQAGLLEFQDDAKQLTQDPATQDRATNILLTEVQKTAYCNRLDGAVQRNLPSDSKWSVKVMGLDCDTAKLSLATAPENFNNLLEAAVKSGIADNSYIDHDISRIQWIERLYDREMRDIGIKSKLQPGNTSICFQCCNSADCPIDGGWSAWSRCSSTCGPGKQVRVCDSPGRQFGGDFCVPSADGTSTIDPDTGIQREERDCNNYHCPINGGWSDWATTWSTCSKLCGTGTQYTTRTCDNPAPRYNGDYCQGSNRQSRTCNIFPCASWSNWTAWGTCSASCGGGSQARTRVCNNENSVVGQTCSGNTSETQSCNTFPCPSWSNWTAWGACSASCGDGSQTRTRSCNNANPALGLNCSGNGSQTQACNDRPCPSWSGWTAWGACSASCGDGSQTRTRSCNNANPALGLNCSGNSSQTQACNDRPCEFRYTLTNSRSNGVNIASLVGSNKNIPVIFTIAAGVTLVAPSTGSCALYTGSGFTDLKIINYGKIYGRGGNGGKGGNAYYGYPGKPKYSNRVEDGGPGGNGGDAICIETNLTLVNRGTIAGGGGGGGGGAGAYDYDRGSGNEIAGGGGGGGGMPYGSGGTGGTYDYGGGARGTAGASASLTRAGTGGAGGKDYGRGSDTDHAIGGNGGNGGNAGSNGASGGATQDYAYNKGRGRPNGSGGASGSAGNKYKNPSGYRITEQ